MPPSGWQLADGEGVSFAGVPYYVGPWQYLAKLGAVKAAIREITARPNAFILRVPSQLAAVAFPMLRRKQQPYGLEVIADPDSVYRSGSRITLSPFFRFKYVRELKRQCQYASAVSYVTQRALQEKYGSSTKAFVTHYSSVSLSKSNLLQRPRQFEMSGGSPRILTVGSLESLVKGADTLIAAALLCRQAGVGIQLVIVGDGRRRTSIQNRVATELREHVTFLGQLPVRAVLAEMEQADLFVLPSRSEGLPAALIEAMAQGLPCISTNVGGIPELLPPEDLVPPGSAQALASKIVEALTTPGRRDAMSRRNLLKAAEYLEDHLRPRRQQYYRVLKNIIEERISQAT